MKLFQTKNACILYEEEITLQYNDFAHIGVDELKAVPWWEKVKSHDKLSHFLTDGRSITFPFLRHSDVYVGTWKEICDGKGTKNWTKFMH